MSKLTDKQERFVQEYMIDLNATQAAIRAGYSERTAQEQGSRLLLKVMVQEAIQEQQKRISEKLEINAEWVIQRLKENFEKAIQAEPVRDKDGNPIGEFTYNGSVANRSLELIGKHIGMFKERVETEININNLKGISNEQLFSELADRGTGERGVKSQVSLRELGGRSIEN